MSQNLDRVLEVIDRGLATAPTSEPAYGTDYFPDLCWRCQRHEPGEGASGVCDDCRSALLDETEEPEPITADLVPDDLGTGYRGNFTADFSDQSDPVERTFDWSAALAERFVADAAVPVDAFEIWHEGDAYEVTVRVAYGNRPATSTFTLAHNYGPLYFQPGDRIQIDGVDEPYLIIDPGAVNAPDPEGPRWRRRGHERLNRVRQWTPAHHQHGRGA